MKMRINKYVLLRKGIHVGAAAIPLFYYVFPRQRLLSLVGSLTTVAVIVELLRFKNPRFKRNFYRVVGSLLWEKEEHTITGATAFLISATISILLFSKPVAVATLLFLVIGDTVAYLVRDTIGGLRDMGKMSLEAVLASFFVSIAIALVVPDLPFRVGLLGAAVASTVETLPWEIDDNLSIPLIAGMLMQFSM